MDDDEMLRDVACLLLESLGYQTLPAGHGAEAIEIYQQAMETEQPVDLVILDLTIPGGMGGQDAVREILAFDPDAKVIVSSGYSNDPVLADFQDHGFKGVVAKPYKVEELSMVLHGIIMGI